MGRERQREIGGKGRVRVREGREEGREKERQNDCLGSCIKSKAAKTFQERIIASFLY